MNYFIEFLNRVGNELQDDDEVLIVKKIIENMDRIYELNLENLAQMTYSSSATIIRFIKRLGFKSYSDFKNKVSVGYERNYVSKERIIIPSKKTAEIVKEELDLDIKMVENVYQTFDANRMMDLIRLMVNSNSVTLIGDYRALEIFYVLSLTLNVYNIPCFIFKQTKILKEHLQSLQEDDLVLYISDMDRYVSYIDLNTIVKKAAILVTNEQIEQFHQDEIYQIIEQNDDLYLGLLFIGKVISYYFPLVLQEEK